MNKCIKNNKYNLSGEYGVGWTSNTNEEFYFDLEDYDKIKDYCWHTSSNGSGYIRLQARERGTHKIVRMSKLITGYSYCEHADRNPLNNRKSNLRPATHKENMQNQSKRKDNTSGVTGVVWDKNLNKWRACIMVDGKNHYLGIFYNKEDAIKARLNGEVKYFNKGFEPQRNLFDMYGIVTN